MNEDPTTATAPNLRGKLIAWLIFVGSLITLSYLLNYATHTSKEETETALFKYSTAVGAAFTYGVMLVVVLAITGNRRELLALRRPRSWLRSLGLAVAVLLVAGIVISVLDSILHGGREQGVVPPHWLPGHTGAYVANWIVVAAVAPFVEESTYRGLGYSLILPGWGAGGAIAATGLLFAASHGFLQAFPELAIFGFALAWLRSRVDSTFPGMAVHCAFNSFALASVFWH